MNAIVEINGKRYEAIALKSLSGKGYDVKIGNHIICGVSENKVTLLF